MIITQSGLCLKIFLTFAIGLLVSVTVRAEYRIEITQDQVSEFRATKPYFNLNFGRVQVSSPHPLEFLTEFRGELRNSLFESNVFSGEADGRLSVSATILEVKKTGDVFPISFQVRVSYELQDKGVKVGAWDIYSNSTSTDFSGATRERNALTLALQRNIRGFFLNLKATYDTEHAIEARKALASLGDEYRSDEANLSALAGYTFLGGAAAVKTVGSVVGDVLGALAQNSGAIAAGLNSVSSGMAGVEAASRGSSVAEDRARAERDTRFYAGIAAEKENPDSEYNRGKREAERKAELRRREDAGRIAQMAATRKEAQATAEQRTRTGAEQVQTQRRADEERLAEQNKREEQARRERQAREEQRRLEQDRIAEQARRDEQARRERQAKEEQRRLELDRLAIAEAARLAPVPPRPVDPREPDEDGCIDAIGWCSSFPEMEQRGTRTVLNFRNTCPFRVYGQFINGRADGSRDAGATHVVAGGTHRWSTGEGTGRGYIRIVGSTKSSMDWVCSGKLAGFRAGDLSLADKR